MLEHIHYGQAGLINSGKAKMSTGFFWDEKCFRHTGGNYAARVPAGGLVQPMVAGGIGLRAACSG